MEIGTLEILLITSTVLELNPLLQAIKIVKHKQANDVSLVTYLMILTIGTMWLFYGIKIESVPLIIGNAIKLGASLTVAIVYWIYRNKRGGE